MPRDLYNVRVVPGPAPSTADGPPPLSAEEERRLQAVLFHDLGNAIADHGLVRFPAHTREDRIRLVRVAERLSAHWGRRVAVEAEDACRLVLRLDDGPTEHLPPAR
ncbi:hypothetical protein ABT026_24475 [Streptomyces sp. NPDC002734]|uniref:hypothetical protein n=1 Tax=Streptomyces sp. NPDC002734 TaxID=3154426 RepID=UPI00331F5242